MNRRIFTAALSALLFTGLTGASAFAQSTTWTIDKNHAQTNFQIRHMGVSTVRGSISGVTGTIVWDENDPSKSTVEATIDIDHRVHEQPDARQGPEVAELLQRGEVSRR